MRARSHRSIFAACLCALCLADLAATRLQAQESLPSSLPPASLALDTHWRGDPPRASNEGSKSVHRRWQRSGAARQPVSTGTPILAEPAGAMSIVMDLTTDPKCDPTLANAFAEELHAAINARPTLRTIPLHIQLDTVAASQSMLPPSSGPLLPPPIIEQEPFVSSADLILAVHVRSIEPYRPMRIDAALELRDTRSGRVLIRFDDVWQAPVDSVVMRATRKGWLRRNWKPTPTMNEGAALEASSPRLFFRGVAAQLAAGLAHELTISGMAIESGSSAPVALHPQP